MKQLMFGSDFTAIASLLNFSRAREFCSMDRSSKLRNLRFTQAMLRELRQKAEADGETLLTYLIDMAYLEASDRIRANWAGDGDDGPIQRRSAQG